MRPIISLALRKNRLSWLVYCVIGFGFLAMYVAIYPSIQQQSAALNDIVKSFPQGILKAFGATSDSLDSLAGLLVSKQYGLIWPLMTAALAISFAGGALAGEIDSGTIGLLLALPISRTQLVLSKLIAGITGLAVFVLATVTAAIPLVAALGYKLSTPAVIKLSLLGFLFGTAVLGVSMLVSAASSSRGRVAAVIGLGLVLMYVANLLSLLLTSLDRLKYISIFYYFDAMGTLSGNHLSLAAVAILLITTIISIVAAIIVFDRRDISA